MPRTYSITFQPGDEIVHVIAKNFNPVNRAEFNPGVESSPCNRPLRTAKPKSRGSQLSCNPHPRLIWVNEKLLGKGKVLYTKAV